MTALFIRYKPFYDSTLARLAGESLSEQQTTEGREFVKNLQAHWDRYNDKVFLFYKDNGFVLPEYWFAYAVHRWKNLIPFDDPLTFFINTNLDLAVAELIHEICHVFFSYYENKILVDKLWSGIQKKFSSEDEITKGHLLVIPMTEACLLNLFGKEKTEALLEAEKHYIGLEKAWNILDSQPSEHKADFLERINLLGKT
jgi:hypothetical protein